MNDILTPTAHRKPTGKIVGTLLWTGLFSVIFSGYIKAGIGGRTFAVIILAILLGIALANTWLED